jgi:hypothetical protein
MSRLFILHKDCGGPLIEDEQMRPDHELDFLSEKEFSVTCLTCLQEVTSTAELSFVDILSQ